MTKTAPQWIQYRYSVLWKRFGEDSFTFDEAKDELEDDKNSMAATMSILRKSGWLTTQFDPQDARKRFYMLKDPRIIVEQISGYEARRKAPEPEEIQKDWSSFYSMLNKKREGLK